MKKKKKKDNSRLYYILIGVFLFIALVSIMAYYSDISQMNRSMQKEGYTTENVDDPFYKRITTGNTLDEYYTSLANHQDAEYEEYYLRKDSYSFIELKMTNQNQVSTVLNISSDLRDNKTIYNFELSYKSTYLLMEGNSNDNYDCKVISRKNMTYEEATDYCNKIQTEISIFEERRNEVIQNERVQILIQNAPPVMEESYEED